MVHQNYRTISSYEAYYRNLREMYNRGSTYYMSNTDLGNGQSLAPWKRPESVPEKVKKKIVKPGDKTAEISEQSQVKLTDKSSAKIIGKLLSTTTE